MSMIQKIKSILFGRDKPAPRSDFKPPVQKVQFSSEPVDPKGHRRPDGDGWRWENGVWVRPVRGISGSGMLEDDLKRRRVGTILSENNPFVGYDGNKRT